MRTAAVYRNGIFVGTLMEENRNRYVFKYDDFYFNDPKQAPLCLTMAKTQKEYQSDFLFPFFFNLLSEGANRKLQCAQWHIDDKDDFGLLLATAQYDTIGAITIKPLKLNE